jgi:AcrR family transcriptional regulator
MATRFSDTKKQKTRELLVSTGKEMFARYGLKKTSIEELTKATGIGQGTFYRFFTSKEALFFEVLEREELTLREQINTILSESEQTRMGLKRVVVLSLTLVSENALMRSLFEGGEYDRFLDSVPEEELASHLVEEERYMNSIIQRLQANGTFRRVKPEVVTGLLHGLFVLYLHKRQIGDAVFSEVIELLTDIVCDALVTRGGGNLTTGSPSYLMEAYRE